MMNKKLKKNFVVLFSLTCLLALTIYSSQAQPTVATIEYHSNQKSKISVNFTEEELKKIKENPTLILNKLNAAGVKCCEPNKKISRCIWECCDGEQIRTCDKILVEALETVWGD